MRGFFDFSRPPASIVSLAGRVSLPSYFATAQLIGREFTRLIFFSRAHEARTREENHAF